MQWPSDLEYQSVLSMFAVRNDEEQHQQRVYVALHGSLLLITIPELDWPGPGGWGHCSSLVGLSLWLVMTRYNLSV